MPVIPRHALRISSIGSQHVLRRTKTIHADDVSARIQQGFGCIGGVRAFHGGVFVFETNRDHDRQASLPRAFDG